MSQINPFKPTSPVPPGMFVGRTQALKSLEQYLIQTKNEQPINFMVTGERGIGKSSLFLYLGALARGEFKSIEDETRFNYLVITTDIESSTTPLSLMKKIKLGIDRQLSETESGKDFLKKAWSFLQRLEVAGTKINPAVDDLEIAIEAFAYSLADTIKRVTEAGNNDLFNASYDGVLLLIDEASSSSEQLDIGTFLKLLSERLQRSSCNKLMIGLAGLPNLRTVLQKSHPSSLRIFDEIVLDRLEGGEVAEIVDCCLEMANRENSIKISISDDAKHLITVYSEGYPHFTQQIGYSAFSNATNGLISKKDVEKGFWGQHGALELIGNRYYRDNFYCKIQKDSYRQVLRIMADHLDEWVKKEQIRKDFKGKTTTLDNAISALKTRNVIISKESERGVYRLQHKGFAVWIKLYGDKG